MACLYYLSSNDIKALYGRCGKHKHTAQGPGLSLLWMRANSLYSNMQPKISNHKPGAGAGEMSTNGGSGVVFCSHQYSWSRGQEYCINTRASLVLLMLYHRNGRNYRSLHYCRSLFRNSGTNVSFVLGMGDSFR